MDDPECTRVQRLLREAEEAVEAMRDIVSEPVDEFLSSPRSRYALRYLVIQLLEALTDLLIVLSRRGPRPVLGYRDVIREARESGLIGAREASTLNSLAGLRNVIVHRYWEVEDERLHRETRERLGEVQRILEVMRGLAHSVGGCGEEEASP